MEPVATALLEPRSLFLAPDFRFRLLLGLQHLRGLLEFFGLRGLGRGA